jgi:hypothetical protein
VIDLVVVFGWLSIGGETIILQLSYCYSTPALIESLARQQTMQGLIPGSEMHFMKVVSI